MKDQKTVVLNLINLIFLQPIKVEHAYGVLKTLKPAEEKVTNKCSACILDRQSNILLNIFFFLHDLLLYIKDGSQEFFEP